MAAIAEPIYWPEPLAELDDDAKQPMPFKIVHMRHRVGDYDVTRVILDCRESAERPVK